MVLHTLYLCVKHKKISKETDLYDDLHHNVPEL